MSSFSNVFNEKMAQFEPKITVNITVCQNKKNKFNDKPKRPAGGDGREENLHSFTLN